MVAAGGASALPQPQWGRGPTFKGRRGKKRGRKGMEGDLFNFWLRT